jgi:hypothetical protein
MKGVFAAAAFILWACLAGAAQEMSYGQTEYLNSCAICHGTTGTGEGPLADQLLKHPADLTRLSEQTAANFPIGSYLPLSTVAMRPTSATIAICRSGGNGSWSATPENTDPKAARPLRPNEFISWPNMSSHCSGDDGMGRLALDCASNGGR